MNTLKSGDPGHVPGSATTGAGEAHQLGHSHYTQNLVENHSLTIKEQCALWWLERDFMLLPVQPNTKKLVRGFGYYRNKITTPERVYQWFGDRSLSNIAVCGTQTSLILDFDDPELYTFWADKFPEAARTYTETTPRGGYHVFAHVWGKDIKAFTPIKGVELKRVALVHPSTIDGKQYAQGAGDLLDLDATLVLSPLSQKPIKEPAARVQTRTHGTGKLAKIKQGFSCVDLLRSENTDLKIPTSSKRFISLPCPFHKDKEPSFWIDTDRNLWGCHACGTRGDVINLYARMKGITNKEAIREMEVTL